MTNHFDQEWTTEHNGKIKVKDMTREHVRNCLQWCSRMEHRTIIGSVIDLDTEPMAWIVEMKGKDGLYYRDWIALFTTRLLATCLL